MVRVSEAGIEVADGVIVRPMLTIDRAIDAFLARGFEETTRATYSRILNRFCDRFPSDWDVAKIKEEDLLLFFALYRNRARGTQAHAEAVIASFFGWLHTTRKIRVNPMGRVERTRRIPAADLDVVTVSSADVPKLLLAARPGAELNCIALAVYLGPRRRALARLKLSDWDRERGLIRFREKGSKTIWKPVPDELASILGAWLDSAAEQGPNGLGRLPAADPYLIPPEGPLTKGGERDDRVIWRLVKKVAKRAGVKAHVHALRAAFAVYFLESHGHDAIALQQLMGHESFETTRVYLRKLDRAVAMESVRDLSWLGSEPAGVSETPTAGSEPHLAQPSGSQFPESRVMGAGGFEPPKREPEGEKRPGREHSENRLDEDLKQAIPKPEPERA
jgi:integrase